MTRILIWRALLIFGSVAFAQTVVATANADDPTMVEESAAEEPAGAGPAAEEPSQDGSCTEQPDDCAVDLDACDATDRGENPRHVDPADSDLCVSPNGKPSKPSAPSKNSRMSELLSGVAEHLVRVDTRMGMGAMGFTFHSEHHVLTSFAAVVWADALTVTRLDGTESRARVVAYDEAGDIALLEVDVPAKSPPPATGAAPKVGDAIYAVGYAIHYGSGDPVIHAGTVNGVGDGRFNSDALEAYFAKVGGPMVNETGAIVGMTRSTGHTLAATIDTAQALAKTIGQQPIYDGPLVLPTFEVGLIGQGNDTSAGGGINLGIGMRFDHQWDVKWRFGLTAFGELRGDDNRGLRVFGQSMAGYRAYLDSDRTYALSFLGGGTLSYERVCEGECSEHEPALSTSLRMMPTLELGVHLWPAQLTYQLQVDVEDTTLSIHQVGLGIDF